ncbi:MAG: AI-2E family transporter [Verrucomicrobiota bacterium]
MEGSEIKKRVGGSGIRVLLSLACVVIVVAGLKAASEFFIPLMLGLFLALLSLPVLTWLTRRRVPRPLAVLLTVFFDLLVLGGVVFLASGVIGEFQDKSAVYAETLRDRAGEFSKSIDDQIERLSLFWTNGGEADPTGAEESGPDLEVTDAVPTENRVSEGSESGSSVEGIIPLGETDFPKLRELFELYWDSERILEALGQADLVARFTSLATKSFIAFIIMIFVLAESFTVGEKVRDVLKVSGPDLSRFKRSSSDIQRYLAIKTAASALTGVLAMISCIFLRIDFPILWGLVAFLLNYIPAIGSIVAGIPPVILALILKGFWPAVAILVCYLVINIVIGNFLEPMLMGKRFGISTSIVIVSVLVWGYIWGPVGMFLAVPLTMVVKVMLDNSQDLRWISALITKGAPQPASDSGGSG